MTTPITAAVGPTIVPKVPPRPEMYAVAKYGALMWTISKASPAPSSSCRARKEPPMASEKDIVERLNAAERIDWMTLDAQNSLTPEEAAVLIRGMDWSSHDPRSRIYNIVRRVIDAVAVTARDTYAEECRAWRYHCNGTVVSGAVKESVAASDALGPLPAKEST